METIENNKMIANFMGVPSYKYRDTIMFEFSDDNHRTAQDLHYDKSWDWLMPVINKVKEDITDEGCDLFGEHMELAHALEDSFWDNNIESAYHQTLELIDVFNKLK